MINNIKLNLRYRKEYRVYKKVLMVTLLLSLVVFTHGQLTITDLEATKFSLPKHVSQKEFKAILEKLDGSLHTYTHREFLLWTNRAGKHQYSMVRYKEFLANFQFRDKKLLTTSDNHYFVDEQSNIGRFGNLAPNSEWAPLQYELLFLATGGSMLAIDATGDGVIDLAIGGRLGYARQYGRMWIETNTFGERLFECLTAGENITPNLISELEEIVEVGASNPCLGSGNSFNSGSGGLVGGFSLPGPNLIDPPNCSFSAGFGHKVIQDPNHVEDVEELLGPELTEEEFKEMLQEIITEIDQAREARYREVVLGALRDPHLIDFEDEEADFLSPAPERTGTFKDGIGNSLRQILIIHEGESSRFRVEPANPFEGNSPKLIFEGFFGEGEANFDFNSNNINHHHNPLQQTPIGPDGVPEIDLQDPRCTGIENDAGHGTLFRNPHFCSGPATLDCLRREEDSIYNITEGNCWYEEGPNDTGHFACFNNNDSFPSCTPTESDPEGRHCENNCAPGNPHCHNPAFRTAQPLDPLNNIIEILCLVDCPFEPTY